jgi:hypothetical protein
MIQRGFGPANQTGGKKMHTETLDQILNGDVAGRFDITREQAERIADRATDGADFVRIWENEDWWVE